MKTILAIVLMMGISGCLSQMPDISFDCNSSFVEIEFKETYLDGLVDMPVRSVFFLKPTDDMGQIFSQNPPASPCSTSDTGDHLSAKFTNFQECAFETTQSGGNITFTYRGVLLTMHDSIVERDTRHFFTFQCFYKDSYNVSTGGIMTYLPNFFSGDTGSATINPVLSLFYDASHMIPLVSNQAVPTSDTIFVTIASGNTFQIEVIKCATSVEANFGDRSQVDFILNGAPVEASVMVSSLKATTAAFSFQPVVNGFGDQNVTLVCEVEVCDLVDSPGGCSKRRKRDADESSGNPHYIVTASFRILPNPESSNDGSQQNQLVSDVPSDPAVPEEATNPEPSTTISEPPTTPQPSTTTTSEPSTSIQKPATTPEPSTTTSKPSTIVMATKEPSTTTTSTIVPKKPNNRKPHKVNQHQQQRQGQISRVIDDGNDDDVTKHDQDVKKSFFEYMKKADILFYVAMALMALMVVLMVVVLYRRCVRSKKVAHVGDQEWAKN